MARDRSLNDVLRKMLQSGDLTFRDFVEVALYHPELGYYARSVSPVGRDADFVTGPAISPVFGYALSRLVREFLSRTGDAVCSIVDIGCGDGSLIHSLYVEDPRARFFGVDRSLDRVRPHPGIRFVTDLGSVEKNSYQLLLSNELFDAFPFARLVARGEHIHELWVTERDGVLDWHEHEAEPAYGDYFASRGIELEDGQFADVSLEWEAFYDDLCRFMDRGLIVTLDYGMAESKLFRGRARRFGTAAAYANQRVSRDLLANPGLQDLTAHINFTDLERAGKRNGFETQFFDIQAKFLLALGAAEHPLLTPVEQIESIELREERDLAKRLVLPDDIGAAIRVLVQSKGMQIEGWSFQKKLW